MIWYNTENWKDFAWRALLLSGIDRDLLFLELGDSNKQ